MEAGQDNGASAPLAYAADVANGLADVLGDALAGAYLHGSAVLGGWTAIRSDVDVLVVLADRVGDGQIGAAGAVLLAAAAQAPGRGLECSAVTVSAAADPGPPWPFVLHLARRDGRADLVTGRGHPGDPDLLMHYAVATAAGVALAGPEPGALIGAVPRHLILEYLAGELSWGLAHASEAYAVLNACRALAYLRDGAIVAKVAGGRAALSRGWGPARTVGSALDQQLGRLPERPPGRAAAEFVVRTAAELRAAAAGQAAGPRASPPA
ncbi:MAG TPA: aminoglycoside adenylyltransferase domain-containing protein [Streptosporangiaceae bacterium]